VAYAANPNATQAAIQAGYSKHTARIVGSQNLTKPIIQARLAELTAHARSTAIATALERQRFWTATMHDPETDMQHRLKASELLGRAQGDFIERMSGDIRVRIVEDDD
jgi:phage terminase small subunit